MKWTSDFNINKELYEVGVRNRTITKFLWFPKCVNDEWRWLETSKIKQHLEHEDSGADDAGYGWDESYTWINVDWVNETPPPMEYKKCDNCGEVIDDKPKDGWFGFATTKTGYLYCGRCSNTNLEKN